MLTGLLGAEAPEPWPPPKGGFERAPLADRADRRRGPFRASQIWIYRITFMASGWVAMNGGQLRLAGVTGLMCMGLECMHMTPQQRLHVLGRRHRVSRES